jgi:hypothetical protein
MPFVLDTFTPQFVVPTSTAVTSGVMPTSSLGSFNKQDTWWRMNVGGVPTYMTYAAPTSISGAMTPVPPNLVQASASLLSVGMQDFEPTEIKALTSFAFQNPSGSGQVSFIPYRYFR